MHDVEQAIAQIGDIRVQLAASTRFHGYAPQVLAIVAVASALVAAAQSVWPQRFAPDNLYQVKVWGAVLLASGLTVALEAVARSRRQHAEMAGAMLRSAMRTLVPVGSAAIVVAVAVCVHAPEAVWLVPGVWLFMIAIALFSSVASLPRGVAWVGSWYMVCATVLLLLAGRSGRLAPWMMGIPLVVGHAAVAWVLWEGRAEAGRGR